MSAFYVPGGDGAYESTEHTRGPWSPDHQHAGPPAALLARELERAGAIEDAHVGRVTFEVLRPIPIAPVDVRARIVRPGRRVELLEGELSAGGEPLMLARAWRLRREAMELPGPAADGPPPVPEAGSESRPPGSRERAGWGRAMDIRFVHGAFARSGPATAWFRIRGELVAGEPATPLDHLFAAADAGNGISALLDWERYAFVNTDLTVHLHRRPAGEWTCLESTTALSPDAVGLARSALYDERGPIGHALQTLIVTPR